MHETIERHMPSRRGSAAPGAAGSRSTAAPDDHTVLANVVQFAEQFPNYVDVIVQCARKTEVDSWPDLFHYAGDPVELFEVRSPLHCALYAQSTSLTWCERAH